MLGNIRNRWRLLLVIAILVISLIVISLIVQFKSSQIKDVSNIKLGDKVNLTGEQEILLKNETIENIKMYLKTPSTAKFQENFTYTCTEPNIIDVNGYVDSQNSFGATIRGNFTCQYFVIDNNITTLVLLKYNNAELFNIKETYLEEYKKQIELNGKNQSGKELNQGKLEYIKEDFNSNEWNDVGKITKVYFNEKESKIDVKVTAKSSKDSKEQRDYWINFNICSILSYFKDFDILGTIKLNIYDIKDKKILELKFDDNFIKNEWNDNNQIDKVKELFKENYKEIL